MTKLLLWRSSYLILFFLKKIFFLLYLRKHNRITLSFQSFSFRNFIKKLFRFKIFQNSIHIRPIPTYSLNSCFLPNLHTRLFFQLRISSNFSRLPLYSSFFPVFQHLSLLNWVGHIKNFGSFRVVNIRISLNIRWEVLPFFFVIAVSQEAF